MPGPNEDILKDLLTPIPRAAMVGEVQTVLGVTDVQARQIVEAFDLFVARPLQDNLKKFRGHDLPKRNPMIYTARGVQTVEDWVSRRLEDRETSAIEGHLGTFLEEVARIVSGGIKPGSGVDLQIEDEEGVVQLYTIQSAPNTKNAGSRRADIDSLKRAAKPLRAARRHVELNMAILWGRAIRGGIKAEPDIKVLATDEFWARVSGVADFRVRLLRASTLLAKLIESRAEDEVMRIKQEADLLFGDEGGSLDIEALADAPSGTSTRYGSKD